MLEIDHAAGTARLVRVGAGDSVETLRSFARASNVRLDGAMDVDVRVVNTNTALYTFSLDSSVAPNVEMESVRAFVGKLGPYLPELGLLATGAPRTRGAGAARRSLLGEPDADLSSGVRAAWTAGMRTEEQLTRLDSVIYGPRGLQETLALTLDALDAMHRGVTSDESSSALRRALSLSTPACQSARPSDFQLAHEVLAAMRQLSQARFDLDASVGAVSLTRGAESRLRDTLALLQSRAQTALADFDPLVANAYHIERLAGMVAGACSYWAAGSLASSSAGRSLMIKVTPRTDPEVGRVATKGGTTYTVTVPRRVVVRPALGLSALFAPQARYSNFGARALPQTGAGMEVYETGVRDARFSWGVTLGLTYAALDRRDAGGFSLWLPELTFNNAGDVKALGVGSAVSFASLKLGTGLLWIRHQELDGLTLGQTIPNVTYLRTNDSYSHPRLYVSLSVFDLAPFSIK